jgi:hypothetical protein
VRKRVIRLQIGLGQRHPEIVVGTVPTLCS